MRLDTMIPVGLSQWLLGIHMLGLVKAPYHE